MYTNSNSLLFPSFIAQQAETMEDLPPGWLYELEMEDSNLINQNHIPTAEVFDFRDLSSGVTQLSQEASTVCVDASWTLDPVINRLGGSRGQALLASPLPPLGQPGPVWAAPNRERPETPEMGNDEYTNLFNQSPKMSYSDVVDDGTEVIQSKSLSRPPLQAKNHIIAERKRRERLNEKLISLAAVIPGLKKMDKASILEDAIRHIKHLTERVKHFERDQKRKECDKPTIINAKRSRQCSYDETSSSDENSSDDNFNPYKKPFPEVDMRVSEEDVMLKIHCKKQEGVLERISNVLSNFSISVASSSNLSFGKAAIDITIIGKMNDEKCSSKEREPLRCLRLAILKIL